MSIATTDNQDELFDIVNEHDEVIGQAKRREVHQNPDLIHRAVGVFVFNSKRQLLMQKRSATKDTGAGLWAFSVGGHVHVGDSYEESVRRELKEELGEDMPLFLWKKELMQKDGESEFQMNYVAMHEGPFAHFDRVEADEVQFFDVSALITASTSGSMGFPKSVIAILPSVQTLIDSGELENLLRGEHL